LKRIALAIFAKTLGVSSVKTRLANEIGVQLAEEFYALSVAAIKEVATVTHRMSEGEIVPHWALAEEQSVDNPQWSDFQRLWTGNGELGKRLHTIYSGLQKQYDGVMMIGTDSPQLSPELLFSAFRRMSSTGCAIGPSVDGGFYLFASALPIPLSVWTGVAYSQSSTLDQLRGAMRHCGISADLLELQGDVDTLADLMDTKDTLERKYTELFSSQKNLYNWCCQNKFSS
jgi:glycosyltransferase A (GT-A) superfamily protein (DUF2064 family)